MSTEGRRLLFAAKKSYFNSLPQGAAFDLALLNRHKNWAKFLLLAVSFHDDDFDYSDVILKQTNTTRRF